MISNRSVIQDESSLYFLIGEAICMIQHLEGALSTAVTLKKEVQYPHRISKNEAENFLKEYQSFTFGRAIKLAKQYDLYPDTLYNELKALLEERNWLVHKFLHQHIDEMYTVTTRNKLFHKVKNISFKAKKIQQAIEEDLITYSESVGIDVSQVRANLQQYFNKSKLKL